MTTDRVPGRVRYPHIHVPLSNQDGNAFFIIGRVTVALRRGGVSREEIDKFRQSATSGNYDNLLAVVMEWVEVS